MVIKTTGIIEFEPENKTKKHNQQASWKRVAMIKTNDDLHLYYSWFLRKRFNLELNRPLRGSHITFINDRNDEIPHFDEGRKIFNGKEITFFHELEPRTNGEHWWLRVHCPEAESIRTVLGGSAQPYFSLHMTIGYANSKNLEHSEYIHKISKLYGIGSTAPRQPLEKHTIHEYGK